MLQTVNTIQTVGLLVGVLSLWARLQPRRIVLGSGYQSISEGYFEVLSVYITSVQVLLCFWIYLWEKNAIMSQEKHGKLIFSIAAFRLQ